jgi:hypothetical protein
MLESHMAIRTTMKLLVVVYTLIAVCIFMYVLWLYFVVCRHTVNRVSLACFEKTTHGK